jgi:hypothetical protein
MVLIIAFQLYEIAIGLAVSLANRSSYWLSLYSLLGTWRLFREPYLVLAAAIDAGGCTVPEPQAYLATQMPEQGCAWVSLEALGCPYR